MEIDEELDTEHSESFYSPFEDDFEQTIALLELDVDEVQVEVEQALEEVEGKKQFPCDFCVKVCKSKGGLTRHQRSKHVAELGEGSSIQSDIPLISEEKVCDLIRDIGRHLVDEKLYRKEHTAEVFKLQPSKSFVTFANQLLVKFKRRSNQDKLLKEFYGSTNSNWREYFHPCDNKKVVFLMLIHLPERLIGLLKERQDDQGLSDSKEELTPQEYGPFVSEKQELL
ncbi:uncharacterized protein LOC114527750 [Dendronephthya gigantea]|uniref:uncharacterized protein LOC114527750 n=1 Tax=Dendronephthya gigantea TaxID=151771 RepID=UPI00106CB066|nr:uncharacterized protein LOC114527750 [Dendronephthya gigantea]